MPSRRRPSQRNRSLVAFVALVLAACAQSPSPAPAPAELRVGITPDSPPLAFRRGGELTGLEVDLARRLGRDLGKPVRFVILPWSDQIPALLTGRTDVVMSGMSVTVGRETQVAFARPYLRSGLAAMTRRADADRWDTPAALARSDAPIGFVEGTTGERFVRGELRATMISPYPNAVAAVQELLQNRIDVFVHDIPAVVWHVAANEGELRVIPKRLNEEGLAWAFRPADAATRTAADAALARWEADGSLARLIDTWLPYWSRVE
jgi:ABC-type amino acid transport substrate-binding protein